LNLRVHVGFSMNVVCGIGFAFQRERFRNFFSLSVMLLLLGIASSRGLLVTPAYAQQVADNATIVIEAESNSSATRGKKLEVTYYQNEECGLRGKSEKVFKKNYAKDRHSFNPLMVETDTRFIFQVSYLEERRGETRACAAISNVALEANRSYKAIFRVVDEVVGCNIRVFDVTDKIQNAVAVVVDDQSPAADANSELLFLQVPVIDTYPESTCAKVGKKSFKSGTPVYSYKDRLG
jgi:hypothetical protein